MTFYHPMKPIKWGFKIHILIDCDNNFIYSYILIPGKKNKNLIKIENNFYTESIVLKLLESLENTNRCVYFDSWYSSIFLCKKLTEKSFKVILTIR